MLHVKKGIYYELLGPLLALQAAESAALASIQHLVTFGCPFESAEEFK